MRSLAAAALIGIVTSATAQVSSGSADLDDLIEMVRSIAQVERKAVITEELAMTSDESAGFWPVYETYTAELKVVDDRLLQLIVNYAASVDTLGDEQARSMVDDYFDLEADRVKIRSKYVRKFDDALPPKKLARFIQVENKLNVIVQLALAEEIPLIE